MRIQNAITTAKQIAIMPLTRLDPIETMPVAPPSNKLVTALAIVAAASESHVLNVSSSKKWPNVSYIEFAQPMKLLA